MSQQKRANLKNAVVWDSDSFVDVGSALDGYAVKASKDFIKIPHYCQTSVNWVPPDGLERKWMVDGVCKGTEYDLEKEKRDLEKENRDLKKENHDLKEKLHSSGAQKQHD